MLQEACAALATFAGGCGRYRSTAPAVLPARSLCYRGAHRRLLQEESYPCSSWTSVACAQHFLSLSPFDKQPCISKYLVHMCCSWSTVPVTAPSAATGAQSVLQGLQPAPVTGGLRCLPPGAVATGAPDPGWVAAAGAQPVLQGQPRRLLQEDLYPCSNWTGNCLRSALPFPLPFG